MKSRISSLWKQDINWDSEIMTIMTPARWMTQREIWRMRMSWSDEWHGVAAMSWVKVGYPVGNLTGWNNSLTPILQEIR